MSNEGVTLFEEYCSNPTTDLRDQLVEENLPLVVKIAKKMRSRVPNDVELDDLISMGSIGLMASIEKYDPDRGIRFSTFASYAIRGRMFDYLREKDWLSRSARSLYKRINGARDEYHRIHNRRPSLEEIATHLDVPVKKIKKWLNRGDRIYSFNTPPRNWDISDGAVPAAMVEDTTASDPMDQVEMSEQVSVILGGVGYRDGFIIYLYYLNGLTMREIGERLRISESRVSQLHKEALLKIRKMLESHG